MPRFTIHLVAGARPNYVKIAALCRAFREYRSAHPKSPVAVRVINTGQHYDYLMSKTFFRELGIPKPAEDLGVGSGTHADQTARIMIAYEAVVQRDKPDLVIVVGDVNSTMACTLVAAKLLIPVAHVEAGLRSRDRAMPEEINRLVTDVLADHLYTTSADANVNLRNEGVPASKIQLVGNVMVDTLLTNLARARTSGIHRRLALKEPYAVLTLHRPSNVDHDEDFLQLLKALERIQRRIHIVFPVHPRTAARLKEGPLGARIRALSNLQMIDPLGYRDFICLLDRARLVLTDSGGIQEETTVLGVPCLTLRENTERPVTIDAGTNVLAGKKAARIIKLAEAILDAPARRRARRPTRWDGRAAERIVTSLAKRYGF